MTVTPLSESEIAQRLAVLPGWEREGDTISKTFKLTSYANGLTFACAVGTLADGFDHHPDMLITWRKVKVTFYTHAAGNKLSHKDFEIAEAIEALNYKAAP